MAIKGRLNPIGKLGDMTNALDKLSKADLIPAATQNKLDKLLGTTESLISKFNDLARGITNAGISLTQLTFDAVWTGMQKVYDLQLRWTKLWAKFNMTIGVGSANMASARKEAMRWESTMRGLTDQMGVGSQMFAELSVALGRHEFLSKKGSMSLMAMTRAFGMSSSGAAKLTTTIVNLQDSYHDAKNANKELNEVFYNMQRAAKAANVSMASFSKYMEETQKLFAAFGRSGRKAYFETIAFAQKLGVSASTLNNLTESFNDFNQSVEMSSKINAMFGTRLNALQLTLADPAERLAAIRDGLLETGRSFEDMSMKERMYLAKNLGMGEDELAGLMRKGMTLDDIQKKMDKNEKKKAKDEMTQRKALAKTSEVIVAWSVVFDKITKAAMKLFEPFLKMFRMTGEGKGLAKVVGEIADKLTGEDGLITKLANSDKFKETMKFLADKTRDFFKNIETILQDPGAMKGMIDGWSGAVKTFVEAISWMMDKVVQYKDKLAGALKWVGENQDLITMFFGLGSAAGLGMVNIRSIMKRKKGKGGGDAADGGGIGGAAAAAGAVASKATGGAESGGSRMLELAENGLDLIPELSAKSAKSHSEKATSAIKATWKALTTESKFSLAGLADAIKNWERTLDVLSMKFDNFLTNGANGLLKVKDSAVNAAKSIADWHESIKASGGYIKNLGGVMSGFGSKMGSMLSTLSKMPLSIGIIGAGIAAWASVITLVSDQWHAFSNWWETFSGKLKEEQDNMLKKNEELIAAKGTKFDEKGNVIQNAQAISGLSKTEMEKYQKQYGGTISGNELYVSAEAKGKILEELKKEIPPLKDLQLQGPAEKKNQKDVEKEADKNLKSQNKIREKKEKEFNKVREDKEENFVKKREKREKGFTSFREAEERALMKLRVLNEMGKGEEILNYVKEHKGSSILEAAEVLHAKLQGRADGGNVRAQTSYVVGEDGPEIFTSNRDGRILPNHTIRTAAATQQNIHIDLNLDGKVIATKVVKIISDPNKAMA